MRKIISLFLALIMVMSFSVVAFAGNGDGTGGGTGGGDDTWDGTPATMTLTVSASKNEYPIDAISIPMIMNTTVGGLKHVSSTNLAEAFNSSTVSLKDSNGKTIPFSISFSNIVGAISSEASFDLNISSSSVKEGGSYVLTIKAGATWANKPKNTTTLESDFTYTFSVAARTVIVETTTAASKQESPLVKDKEETTVEESTTVEETTTEIVETTVAIIEETTVEETETLDIVAVESNDDSALVIALCVSAGFLVVALVIRKKVVI